VDTDIITAFNAFMPVNYVDDYILFYQSK